MRRKSARLQVSMTMLLLLGSVSVHAAFAQTTSASLSGVVRDASQALIPGVTVKAKNAGTGVESTTITNETGSYNFPSLLPGTYEVAAELPGFKPTAYKGLVIGLTQVRQDFTLEVGAASETVEVTTTLDSVLRESSASIGDVLPQERARELPLVGANILDLMKIMPGMKAAPFTSAGFADTDTFAGQYAATVNVTRDGLSVNSARNDPNVWGLQSTTNINPDLVGEVRLILSPMDPEYRGNAQIQISTRSGTNQYAGSLTWRVHNTAFDSNTWLNNHTAFTDPVTGQRRNSTPLNWVNNHGFIGSYGGPIVRNKTFFFASWDQQLSYNRSFVNATVLTDTARMGIYRYFQGWNPANPVTVQDPITGNVATQVAPSVDLSGNPKAPPDGAPLRCFSVFGNRRYDEAANSLVSIGAADAARFCPGGTFVFGPSQGSNWDAQRLSPDQSGYVQQLLRAMPRANAFGTGDGLNTATFSWARGQKGSQASFGGNSLAGAGADPNNVNRKQFTIKIDENLSTKHRLSANWSVERTNSTGAIVDWPAGLFGDVRTRPQTLAASVSSTLSPSLLNEFRFGIRYDWARNIGAWENPDAAVREQAAKWFLPGGTNAVLGPYSPAAPGSIAYYAAVNSTLAGMPSNGAINSTFSGSGHNSPLWSFADNVSWTRGRHAFKMGGEIRLSRSKGYGADSYPSVSLGAWGANATPFASTTQFADVLPGFLSQTASGTAARAAASNLLYLLSGSVSSANTNYWINSAEDAAKGKWQDIFSTGKRYRSQVANDYSLFFKDDWKFNSRLTLNMGVRWEYYASPYIREGFTSRIVDQGLGLFGAHRPEDPEDLLKDWLTSPPRIYLSGYGSSVSASNALACTKGVANPNGIPSSACDPSLLTASEFVGPNTPNPDKPSFPRSWTNFAPSVGFAWTVPWFGQGKTTMRGGVGMTYSTPGRTGTNLENALGAAPGSTITGSFSTADSQFQPILNSGRVPNVTDLAVLVPVKPNRGPGLPLPISGRTTIGVQAWDPNFQLPYVMNVNLSITRQLRRNMILDVRYVGAFQRRQDTTFDMNVFNVFYNPELFQALVDARAGKDPVLLDQLLAGLDLHGPAGAGYGPVGTVVNGVYQTGAAHLRRNATFTTNLANGNFVGVIQSLYNLSSTSSTATGLLQPLPAGLAGVGARVGRNGCDRMANGYSYVQQPAPGAFSTGFNASSATPLRCFPEDYFITNPQFARGSGAGTAILHTNYGRDNYNAMQLQYTLRPTQGTTFQATYAWDKSLNFPPPYFIPTTFVDPKRPENEYVVDWATTSHDFRVTGTFELPIGPSRLFFGKSSGWVARVLERWSFGIIERNTSGLPRDPFGAPMLFRSGGGDRPYPRPDIVGPWVKPNLNPQWAGNEGWIWGHPTKYTNFRDPQCANNVANGSVRSNPDSGTGPGQFNFGASCTLTGLAVLTSQGTPGAWPVLAANGNPTGQYAVSVLRNSMPGTQGNFPHSKLQLPRRQTLDANLSKTLMLTEGKILQVRADATNVLNHPNWGEPTLSIQSSNFGRSTNKGTPGNRIFQLQVRLTF